MPQQQPVIPGWAWALIVGAFVILMVASVAATIAYGGGPVVVGGVRRPWYHRMYRPFWGWRRRPRPFRRPGVRVIL